MEDQEKMMEQLQNRPPAEEKGGVERTQEEVKEDIAETKMAQQRGEWESVFTAKLQYLLEAKGIWNIVNKLKDQNILNERNYIGHKILFDMAASRMATLGNITRDEKDRHLTYFDCTFLELKREGYNLRGSIVTNLREKFEMQLTRAVQGFERKAQITTRSEQQVSQQLGMGGEHEEGGGWWPF